MLLRERVGLYWSICCYLYIAGCFSHVYGFNKARSASDLNDKNKVVNAAASLSQKVKLEKHKQLKNAASSTERHTNQFPIPAGGFPVANIGSAYPGQQEHVIIWGDLAVQEGPITIQGEHEVFEIDDSTSRVGTYVYRDAVGTIITDPLLQTDATRSMVPRLFKKVCNFCHFDPSTDSLEFKFEDNALLAAGASVDLTFVTTVWENNPPYGQQSLPIPVVFVVKGLHVHPCMIEGSYDPEHASRFFTANVNAQQQDCGLLASLQTNLLQPLLEAYLITPEQYQAITSPPCPEIIPGDIHDTRRLFAEGRLVTLEDQATTNIFLRVWFRKCFDGIGTKNFVKLGIYPGADDELHVYGNSLSHLSSVGLDNGKTFLADKDLSEGQKKSTLRIGAGLLSYSVSSPNLRDNSVTGEPNPKCTSLKCEPEVSDCIEGLSTDELQALLDKLLCIINPSDPSCLTKLKK